MLGQFLQDVGTGGDLMAPYLLRRLALVPATLLLVSLLVFGVMRLIPGDPATLQIGDDASQARIAELRKQLGLDRPVYVQYFAWLRDVVQLDLGHSLNSHRSVQSELGRAIPISVQLATMAIFLAALIGIPLGIIASVTQGSVVDYVARIVAVLGLSIPSFVLGTVLLLVPAVWFGWFPPTGYIPIHRDPLTNISQFLLPAASIGYRSSAVTARMVRSSMLEVLHQDYVRTAWSKGLHRRTIVLRHALRNALIPVITILGTQLGFLMGGALISETIFSLPGVGRLFVTAVADRDYPVIQGVILFMATVVVLLNLVVDVLYAAIDPRIRYS